MCDMVDSDSDLPVSLEENCLVRFSPDRNPFKPFEAKLCGADEENFIYIRSTDSINLENYANLRTALAKEYNLTVNKPLLQEDIVPGEHAILQENDEFYRVRILKKRDVGVTCYKYDEGQCVTSTARRIFPLPEKLRMLPNSILKCRLHGLRFFDGLPHLQLALKLIIMGEVCSPIVYTVEIISCEDFVPLVKMTRPAQGGETSLTNEVQKFIPSLCHPRMPRDNSIFQGDILHVNYKASVWFTDYESNQLFLKIQNVSHDYQAATTTRCEICLQTNCGGMVGSNASHTPRHSPRPSVRSLSPDDGNYDPIPELRWSQTSSSSSSTMSTPSSPTSPTSPKLLALEFRERDSKVPAEDAWKQPYFDKRTGIYMTEFGDGLYRARITRIYPRNRVEVEFLDYGNVIITARHKLIPIGKLDENLAFIPPQCLKARLKGFYRINTDFFWRLVDESSTNMILTTNRIEEEWMREIEIFKENSDFSINEVWKHAQVGR